MIVFAIVIIISLLMAILSNLEQIVRLLKRMIDAALQDKGE